MVIALFAGLFAGLITPSFAYTLSTPRGIRALATLRPRVGLRGPVACDGDDDLNFGDDLLRMPQISTPERESFKAYRERQRQRKYDANAKPETEAERIRKEMESLPLGMEPVLGEPRDLSEPEWREPTPEEIAVAEEDFQSLLGGPAQRFKASIEKVDDLGIGEGIDKLIDP